MYNSPPILSLGVSVLSAGTGFRFEGIDDCKAPSFAYTSPHLSVHLLHIHGKDHFGQCMFYCILYVANP